MPIPNSMDHGNLYVIFDVSFPSNHFLPEEADYKKLESLLPARPKVSVPRNSADVEEVSLAEFEEARYQRTNNRREAYNAEEDSDDEMSGGGHPGAQHVQCAQQ
jgi:DnaJ family protein A protein 2